jgi:hypothetical protein
VKLFNLKDLTGWKTHPDKPGNWQVKDKILIGSGPLNHLFSERGDYENFELRVEAKINKVGNSGVLFHSKYGHDFELPQQQEVIKLPSAYEVELGSAANQGTFPIGSVIRLDPQFTSHMATTPVIADDTWFTLEIAVHGKRIVSKVNGETVTDFEEREPLNRKGHFALQVLHPETVVQFRKIEIKELPPEEAAWVQLFNGNDLDGWDKSEHWKVIDHVLTGNLQEGQYYLASRHGPFANFHVRADVRLQGSSHGALLFRAGETLNSYDLQLSTTHAGSLGLLGVTW